MKFIENQSEHLSKQTLYHLKKRVTRRSRRAREPSRIPLLFLGVANGTSENVGLGKFWQDLEISEAFLISLEVSFLHGLYLLFLSLETFYQRVSGSDF